MENITVINQRTPFVKVPGSSFVLDTCVRHLWWGPSCLTPSERAPDAQVLRGVAAISYFTEVICGLHSPIVGETEIFGQFKLAFDQSQKDFYQRPLMQKLNELAKRTRHLYLRDIGSSSYGSLCRKQLAGVESVVMIGAGHLAQEILPWLTKKGHRVNILTKSPKKRCAEISLSEGVRISPLSDAELIAGTNNQGLIIAAPIRSCELKGLSGYKKIIDLRAGEEVLQSQAPNSQILTLQQIFASFEVQRHLAKKRVNEAKSFIKKELDNIQFDVNHRPMGWDDLCVS